MPNATPAQTIEQHLSQGKVAELLRRHFGLRHQQRHVFLRLILACPDELVAGLSIVWDELKVEFGQLDKTVTEAELRAWVTPTRPIPLLRWVLGVLHSEVADPITIEQYLEMVAQRAPAAFPKVADQVFSQDRSEVTRELFHRHAAAYVDGLIADGSLGSVFSGVLERLPAEEAGRLIEHVAGTEEVVPHNVLRTLNSAAHAAPEAFATLVSRAIGSIKKNEIGSLWLDMQALSADDFEKIISAVKGKEAHFTRAAFLTATTQTSAASEALSRFLGHKKRGRLCARWLTQLGVQGREAAEAAAARATKKNQTDARVRELAAIVVTLPTAPSFLIDVGNRADSVWHRDPEAFVISPSPSALTSPPYAPIEFEDAKRALEKKKHADKDLTPHQWADLLQLVTTAGWSEDLAWARQEALKRGRLGWGADRAKLAEAIGRFNFARPIKLGSGSGDAMGLYHLLIGARAPRDVLLHGMALAWRQKPGLSLGSVDRNFKDALQKWKPEHHEALMLHATHLQLMDRSKLDEFSRFPTLEESSSAGAEWNSVEEYGDFRMRAEISSATEILVRFRSGAKFRVDLSKRTWSQEGLGSKRDGLTSLFGDEPSVQIGIEAVGPLVRIGVNGTLIGDMPSGKTFDVREDGGRVAVETDGSIESVRVTGAGSSRAAGDQVRLIGTPEKNHIADVAGAETASAALTLAALVSLSDEDEVADEAAKALSKMPAVASPWREVLGLQQIEVGEMPFVVRPFKECVAIFGATKKAKLKLVAGLGDYSLALGFKNPGGQGSSGYGAISEDTVYLNTNENEVLDAQGLMDTSMPAIMAWNSRGRGKCALEAGSWTIMTCHDLMRVQDEYGDFMSITLACWKVEEGVAYAAWKGEEEKLVDIIGLRDGWPSRRAWTEMDVWIGE